MEFHMVMFMEKLRVKNGLSSLVDTKEDFLNNLHVSKFQKSGGGPGIMAWRTLWSRLEHPEDTCWVWAC